MARYLISFHDEAMTFPDEELPDVAKASMDVDRAAQAAGIWVFGGGLDSHEVSVVGTDGSVTVGTCSQSTEHVGGFSILDVASREEALAWAAKIAVACRCAQDVRELMPEPDV